MPRIARFFRYGSGKPPVLLTFRSSRWFITVTVALAIFTDVFLYGVIVPVLPFALHARAGVPQEDIQTWVSVLLAVYGAALLIGAPIWGYISDHTASRRWPFLAGLLLLLGATVLLCVGQSIPLFILGRILQGLSSAVVWTTGLVIIVDTVGQKNVGQYMGYAALAMSLGILVAPLLGGVVYARAGYYAVFAMCFGILLCDIVLRVVMVEIKVAARWLPAAELTLKANASTAVQPSVADFDDPEAATGVEPERPRRLSLISLRDNPPPPPPHPRPRRPSTTPSALILTILPSRLPPILTLLRSRRLLASLWASLIQAALLTSFDSTLPLLTHSLFHWNSLGAGLIFLPLVLPSFLGPLVGSLSDKHGPKYPASLGFLCAVPLLTSLRFVRHDGLPQKALLCALLALLGCCLASVLSPVMAEIAYVVEEKERKRPGVWGAKGAYAQAYALFNVAFAAGCLVGPIWGGLIKEAAGWGTMCWTLGLLSGFTAAVTLGWIGGWIGDVGMSGGGGHGGESLAKEEEGRVAGSDASKGAGGWDSPKGVGEWDSPKKVGDGGVGELGPVVGRTSVDIMEK